MCRVPGGYVFYDSSLNGYAFYGSSLNRREKGMFKRAAEKVATFVKTMFWFLSVLYFFADLAVAGVLSVVVVGGSKILLGLGRYVKGISAIKINPDLIPGVAAGITIVIWLVALVSIPVVIMLLYQGALVLIMFANTSRDVDECKQALRRLESK